MTPKEMIDDFALRIKNLKAEEAAYRKELIASVIQESTNGNKLVMVRPDGQKFLIQRYANTRGGRNIYDENGNIVRCDVRHSIDDVKYVICLI